MTTLIRTLCEPCARQYGDMFSVKPYPGRSTTEKKQICEACKRQLPSHDLRQYVLSQKRRR